MISKDRSSAHLNLTRLVLALITLTGPLTLVAQAVDSTAGVTTLGSVTVTASGFEQEMRDAPASITVISREELESRQFRSLADAVRHVEGVSIIGGDKGNISIRGMESSHVLILVDGRRQNTGQVSLKGGTAEALSMNWIPPVEAIERIEVVRGPMSTLYGSEAMGGVINVVTRKVAHAWMGAVSADYTYQESSDAGNMTQGDVYLSGPLVQDLLGIQVWGFDKRRQEDDLLDGFAKSRRQGGNARFWLTPSASHEFMFEAGRSKQHFWNTAGRTLGVSSTNNENEYIRDNYAVAHTGKWGRATTELSFNHERAVREGPTQNAKPDVRNSVVEGKVTLPFKNHMVLAGLQWRRDELKTDGYYASPQGLGVDTSVTETSFFVEDEWSLTDDFSLTGGLRLDDNEFFGKHWTPRLYGVWHTSDNWTVKGGVAKGFQSPTITQINPDIGLPQRGGAYTWGNPDLEPEKSVNSEVGVYYDAGGAFSGSLTLFHTDFDNKIANTGSRQLYYPDGTPVPPDPFTGNMYSTYFNITKATVRGLELGAGYRLNEQFKLRGNYTYTDSKVKSANATILGFGYPQADGQPLVATPSHMGSLTLDWQPNAAVAVFSTLSYRGRETQIAWGQGGAVNESVGSVTTVDLGANWRVNKALTLSAVAYNITDKVRERDSGSAYSYAEDGRRYWAKLSYQF
ncbi:TonB-dependent receptor [Paenalcaligenes niemegkensis]|uniref:TonB-dependent receptor domain-containing protein n=1 Tax=Paenalcaligenes niemegkensis TaxID=2895469 RepID=UPI001EE87CFE|nr:TonB-dependent receptor [Paenalcaligenes niemegkensis]MCQ9616572.1 TonB-dependent receptor [Paenalcaligenes niemegkensis]